LRPRAVAKNEVVGLEEVEDEVQELVEELALEDDEWQAPEPGTFVSP
jgi:hypothetical protein